MSATTTTIAIHYLRALALVLGLGAAATALAERPGITGRWALDDQIVAKGSKASLRIKDTSMTWRDPDGKEPPCQRRFEIVQERPGTVYRDARGTKFVAGFPGSIPTYLLKIVESSCGGADLVRIRFPLIYDTRHIEVLELENGRVASVRRFHRVK